MGNIDTIQLYWLDYVSLLFVIGVSFMIGLYYGFFKKNQNSVIEYMFGGKKMPIIPVSLSIMASTISNITLISWSSEIYYYGGVIIFLALGQMTSIVLIYFFYLPVFYHLEYTSLFEYLERRFNKSFRNIGSVIYLITQIFYVMIIMYAASTAVTQATKIPYNMFTPLLCLICTIYTVLGGVRGVIWTDFLQTVFMFVSVIVVIILGVQKFDNGIADIFSISHKGGRLDFLSFDLNPFVRNTPWIEYIAAIVLNTLTFGINPGVMQRYLSLPSFTKAKKVAIISGSLTFLIMTLAMFLGWVIYAYYHDCDPSMSQALRDRNQLVTYYIRDVLKDVPGLTGLFLAGILSAALSSMSTIMNVFSGTIFEDLVKPLLPWELTDAQSSLCIKCIAVVFGITISFGIFGLNAIGGIFQLFRTMISLTGGLIVFIFSFGMCFRKDGTKAAIAGALAGLVTTFWIGTGNLAAISSGRIQYSTRVLSIEGCHGNVTELLGLNSTTTGSSHYSTPVMFADDVPYIYRISFNLLAPLGLTISVVVAFLVSLITNNGMVVEEKLLIPQIRKNYTNCTMNCDNIQCQEMDHIVYSE